MAGETFLLEEGVNTDLVHLIAVRGWRSAAVPRWHPALGVMNALLVDLNRGMLVGVVDPRGNGHAAGY